MEVGYNDASLSSVAINIGDPVRDRIVKRNV